MRYYLLLLGIINFLVLPTQATTLMVNTLTNNWQNDGQCSLREAIQAANQNRAIDGCPAGSATQTDVIMFAKSGTIVFTNPLMVNDNLIISGGKRQISFSGEGKSRLLEVMPEVGLTLQDITLESANTYHFGGGVYNKGGTLNLFYVTLKNNVAKGSTSGGAAIFNNRGLLNIHYSLFANNEASSYGGGGVFNYQGKVNIESSRFLDNIAKKGFGGAGVYNYEGVLNVLNSTFAGNHGSFGGALSTWGGVSNIANSTFSANQASFGAGIDNYIGQVYLTHVTMVNNQAIYGGGIDNNGEIVLVNSLIAGNQATRQGAQCRNGTNSQIIADHYNVFSTDSEQCSVGRRDKLISGELQTVFEGSLRNGEVDNFPATHALVAGSMAIDAVPAQACQYASETYVNPLFSTGDRVITDQRGATRGQACDVGAYEWDAIPPAKLPPSPSLPHSERLTITVEGPGVVSSYPLGIDCGHQCSESFARGQIIRLTAVAAEGAVFEKWTGDCQPAERQTRSLAVMPVNKTIQVVMDRAKRCTAQFKD